MSELSKEETTTPCKAPMTSIPIDHPWGDGSNQCITSNYVVPAQQISFGSTRLLHKIG